MSGPSTSPGRSGPAPAGAPVIAPGSALALGRALRPSIIAIDGPAGSGKSTVGFGVAQALGYLFFDTGAMYRAVTWTALARGIDLRDEAAIGGLAEAIDIDILPPPDSQGEGRNSTVLVDGEEISEQIRRPEVDRQVSLVSSYARVRAAMSRQQQRIGRRYGSGAGERAGVVMVGRDIGTVIVPEAPLKVYLDASVEERARRRYQDLLARGREVSFEQVLADLVRRDEWDSSRALSPLRIAEDAIVVDTSAMTVEQVVAAILRLVARKVEEQRGAANGRL
ncbi:MAG TPA: (d)CMP kinase [Caldilineaceae bacterium]|nr:(d)CMP kinase [Caldilineaceae bacterium]